jgi:hypothetical protein
MRITIEIHRPARRTAALALAALLILVPGVALASHQFTDVPNSNVFHDDIAAMAEAGITAGLGDGGYHPADPVTRQAMAAFLHRGLGRVGLAINEAPMSNAVVVPIGEDSSDWVSIRQITMTVPGAANAFSPAQLVYLRGHVEFFTQMGGAVPGCACEFAARILEPASALATVSQSQTFDALSENTYSWSFDVEGLLAGAPGVHTYVLQVAMSDRLSTTYQGSYNLAAKSSLSALSVPFDVDGTIDT